MLKLQVLGGGCDKCNALAANAEEAAANLGVDYEMEKVTDLNEIMKYGVMVTPALVVDGEEKVVGKVASTNELQDLIT